MSEYERDEMRPSRVVRASDCQCRSRNSPGFDPGIIRHSGMRGAEDEAVLNKVLKIPFLIMKHSVIIGRPKGRLVKCPVVYYYPVWTSSDLYKSVRLGTIWSSEWSSGSTTSGPTSSPWTSSPSWRCSLTSSRYCTCTVKKVSDFPVPSRDAGNYKLFPAWKSLVSDIPARDGKLANLFTMW